MLSDFFIRGGSASLQAMEASPASEVGTLPRPERTRKESGLWGFLHGGIKLVGEGEKKLAYQ